MELHAARRGGEDLIGDTNLWNRVADVCIVVVVAVCLFKSSALSFLATEVNLTVWSEVSRTD